MYVCPAERVLEVQVPEWLIGESSPGMNGLTIYFVGT